jgi:hypothetical protein
MNVLLKMMGLKLKWKEGNRKFGGGGGGRKCRGTMKEK